MLLVTLYTKDGCHLCEEVRQDLRDLSRRYPHRLRQVDITSDPALFARYRLSIPVVEIGDRRLAAPIDTQQLQEVLRRSSGE